MLSCLTAQAQKDSVNNSFFKLPNIPGYLTLKGDFHMHTVLSDGYVWPALRAQEAIRDGLDVISVTEHVDFVRYPKDIKRDMNRAYEIAQQAAGKSGLLVINGLEISPRVPPYHCNAIFMEDGNKVPVKYMKQATESFKMKDNPTRAELMAPFLEAKKQDAFVFYNHPSFSWWDKKEKTVFTDFHQELLEKGILKGVEVANRGGYNVIAHQLAAKYNLAMFANSDEHRGLPAATPEKHRPVTLVFAQSKTPAALKEAMNARRTAVYFDDYVIGRKQEMEPFFKAAVTITAVQENRKGEPIIVLNIKNNTTIPFQVKLKSDYHLEKFPLGAVTLKPEAVTKVTLGAVWEYPAQLLLKCTVDNILVAPEEALQTEFKLATVAGGKKSNAPAQETDTE
ncbi:MAG: Sb-PDE family phosphodiesterase [Rufibacter sp.]